MKKLLLVLVALVVFVPLATVKAANEIEVRFTCDPVQGSPIPLGTEVTCRVYGTPLNGSFTEFGYNLTSASQSAVVTSVSLNNEQFTGTATTSKVTGTAATAKSVQTLLFTFTYKVNSIKLPCNIILDPVAVDQPNVEIPYNPEPGDVDENPNTGSSLPYFLVGGAALMAIVVYILATKKSKFYRV